MSSCSWTHSSTSTGSSACSSSRRTASCERGSHSEWSAAAAGSTCSHTAKLGFNRIFDSQITADLGIGRDLPLVTIPLYALLKLVAYSDRLIPRDPASVLHCLIHYEEDSERLYGVEHGGTLIDFDVAGAYLLGRDGEQLVDGALAATIRPILEALADPDSPLGSSTVYEYRNGSYDERLRELTARLFDAYRTGLGV